MVGNPVQEKENSEFQTICSLGKAHTIQSWKNYGVHNLLWSSVLDSMISFVVDEIGRQNRDNLIFS